MVKKAKVRVNISVDKELLEKAKTKLRLFGGKLSTLFNAYLADFVEDIDKKFGDHQKVMEDKIKEIDEKIKKIGKRLDKKEKNRRGEYL